MQHENHILIVYVDDDGEKVDHWVELIELTQTLVKFKDTKGNIITIPIHRLLKIKQRGDAE